MVANRTRTVSQVIPSPIRWLWEPYLARGRALLDGDPRSASHSSRLTLRLD